MLQRTVIGVCFTQNCIRRDNGLQTNVRCTVQAFGGGDAPNGFTTTPGAVRDRQILITDEGKGVVMALVMIDDVSEKCTDMLISLVKARNYAVDRVESMVAWMPLGYASALGGQNIARIYQRT
ncbi:hypothetical protein P154DRAFT_581863 [Amniculicola lignicola CBS 123094]|uniref:DUF8021 domain-containing protein n=1 Tax=Amniculicola lignicola CBS 123094 TaxID=1392246 RepID=A0A6A5VZP1_9PLEO|nr:hypothetical protein P154DRAFT_581863 [Amniculicola lignicola CBS 123094]